MLTTLAIENYRSIVKLVLPLTRLNIVTGSNGTGKSNLYKALRLLSQAAQQGITQAIAEEGGLDSLFWAGSSRKSPTRQAERYQRLRLGFSSDTYSYAAVLGLPPASQSLFSREPELKYEAIWHGELLRPASSLLLREGAIIKNRVPQGWQVVQQHCPTFNSIFDQVADPLASPEVFTLREYIRSWRFYDQFRTDHAAPARQAQVARRCQALAHDGSDVAAALQTIIEIGDVKALQAAVADAFPGCQVAVQNIDGRFQLHFYQADFNRPLSAAELSDGTLRYLLWVAALLTPRPPALMVLNEPEASLHPDLLPALARLIRYAANHCQVWVVSHSPRLIAALAADERSQQLMLDKAGGETVLMGADLLSAPAWRWPD